MAQNNAPRIVELSHINNSPGRKVTMTEKWCQGNTLLEHWSRVLTRTLPTEKLNRTVFDIKYPFSLEQYSVQ